LILRNGLFLFSEDLLFWLWLSCHGWFGSFIQGKEEARSESSCWREKWKRSSAF
jgi:hypothetical protein